jgi:catechol 2,3-dioxygenase-like lactoylglutathione lyase family enzyme
MDLAAPILPAGDLTVAKAFYVDGLGFRVTFEVSENGRSGLLGLERGAIQLTLDSPMKGYGRDACVALHVDDPNTYYREWSPKVRSFERREARSEESERSTAVVEIRATVSYSRTSGSHRRARAST